MPRLPRIASPRSASYIVMPHSKMHAVIKFHERLDEVAGLPGLLLGDPHDAVAEVVVLADDVRVLVVGLVVRALPLRGRRRVVPVPGRRVDLRVAHPVPLPVQDVVPDLHVLEALGEGEARRCPAPRPTATGPPAARRDRRAPARAARRSPGGCTPRRARPGSRSPARAARPARARSPRCLRASGGTRRTGGDRE